MRAAAAGPPLAEGASVSEPAHAWRERYLDALREFGLLCQAMETSPDDIHAEARLDHLTEQIDDLETLRTLVRWFAYHFYFQDAGEEAE